MEEKKNNKGVNIIAALVLYAIIALGMCFDFTVPATAILAASIVLMPGWMCLIPICATGALTIAVYGMSVVSLMSVAVFVITGLAAGFMIRSKAPNRIVLLVICTLVIVLSFGLDFIEAHIRNTSVVSLLTEYIDTSMLDQLSSYGFDIEAFIYATEAFSSMMLAGAIFVFSRIATILLSLIPAFKDTRRGGLLRPIAPFMLWMLSDNFTVGLGVATIAVIAVNAIGLANASVVSFVIATIFLTPVFVQGISFMMFLITALRRNGRSLISVVLLFISCALLTPVSFLLLGFIDQFTHYRKRRLTVSVISVGDDNRTNDKEDDDGQSENGQGDDAEKRNDDGD